MAAPAGADEVDYLYDLRSRGWTGSDQWLLSWGYMICADKRMGVPLSTTVDNIVYRMGALNSAEVVHVYVQAEYELGCKWGDPA